MHQLRIIDHGCWERPCRPIKQCCSIKWTRPYLHSGIKSTRHDNLYLRKLKKILVKCVRARKLIYTSTILTVNKWHNFNYIKDLILNNSNPHFFQQLADLYVKEVCINFQLMSIFSLRKILISLLLSHLSYNESSI